MVDIVGILGRLGIEEREVTRKINKLGEAIAIEESDRKLGDYEYSLMLLQHSTLITYRYVLNLRINDLQKKKEKNDS